MKRNYEYAPISKEKKTGAIIVLGGLSALLVVLLVLQISKW